MIDTSTNYLGLRLKNPIVAGASPLSRDVGTVRALEDAGVAAVVVYSLFQEQIEYEADRADHFEELGTESYAESLSYMPSMAVVKRDPEDYVQHIGLLKEAVNVPIIASVNGHSLGGWIEYARLLEQAGADALEINLYHLATDVNQCAHQVEDEYVEVLHAVKETVSLPIAMKLSPYFSSLPHFAKQLDEGGVDGLVLFNRFYQPDIDLEQLEVSPSLSLSAPHEMLLPLRWIAILDPLIEASLAASTGIYSVADVIKLLLVGADATLLCAALLRHGPGVITRLLADLQDWLQDREYESVQQLQGSMNYETCPEPAALERANYMQSLETYV